MPGYNEDIDPVTLADYKSRAKAPASRPRRCEAVVLCACGCGKRVRNPNRARFAHGGRPTRPHGSLPPECKIDEGDHHFLVGRSWHITNTGYVAARISNKIVLLHRLLTGAPPDTVVDHINGDRLDNRRANLRVVSQGMNSQNQRLSGASSSGYRGVSWDRQRNKWIAQATLHGRHIFIGRFDTIEQAAEAAHLWRVENMPAYQPDRLFNHRSRRRYRRRI